MYRWQENGWGSLVWIAAFLISSAIRSPHMRRIRANEIVDDRKDATEKLLLAGMFLTMMVLPFLQLGLGAFSFADYSLPAWATAIGASVQIPMLWLFWRSHADLDRNWSPTLVVHKEQDLVTNGVYARIRHPMYAAIWLSALAQPLLIHNWIGGALVIPAFAAMWFIRIPKEEAMLRERFGAAYDAYCNRAGRLAPKLTNTLNLGKNSDPSSD
ncbi:MAG: protein-S-isoprenylcysteine O-methyltransferase [Pseudomonadota bacterium]